jgi:hypothetical protein
VKSEPVDDPSEIRNESSSTLAMVTNQTTSLSVSAAGAAVDDEAFGDDDIVIVSHPDLNIPPIQYSKQYYDLNINGLEAEFKRFNQQMTQSNIASITKSPIKPSSLDLAAQKQSQPQQHQQQNNTRRLKQKQQRFSNY